MDYVVKKNVLILGVTSTIGYSLYSNNRAHNISGVCRNWPLNNTKNIYENNCIDASYIGDLILKLKPDIVVNCIGIGDVDKCEKNKKEAFFVNYELVVELFNQINRCGVPVLNFSSSLIYDGVDFPFNEKSNANPINEYGRIKLMADSYFRKTLSKN